MTREQYLKAIEKRTSVVKKKKKKKNSAARFRLSIFPFSPARTFSDSGFG